MTPRKDHAEYEAIQHHIRHAGLERSAALGQAIAGVLGKAVQTLKRYAVPPRREQKHVAHGQLAIATGQFERLGNAHREILDSVRANARRELLAATGSSPRRPHAER